MSGPYSFGSNGAYDPVTFAQRLRDKIAGSPIAGQAPAWGAQFGIKTGSPEEWTRFFTMVGQQESGHRIAPTNPDGSLRRFSTTIPTERSFGPYQFNKGEYGLNTWQDVNDPDKVADALIRVAHQGKVPAYFGSVQRPRETLQHASWYDKNIAPRLNSQFDLEGAAFNGAPQPIAPSAAPIPRETSAPGAAAMAAPPMPAAYSNAPTPEQIAQSRKMGQALMQQGMSTEPVQHWTQALARVLQAGVGRAHMSEAEAQQRQSNEAMAALLAGNPTPQQLMMNPATRDIGGSLLLSQFRRQNDPMAALQEEKARMDLEEAKAMNPLRRKKAEAEVQALGQKDALDQYIMSIIGGGQNQAPGSPIQPQSYMPQDGPGTDPNVIRTQTAQPPGLPQAQSAADPVVDTPAGRMPASQAQKLGFAFALKGKGEAGKMLAEAAKDGRLDKTAQGEVQKDIVGLTNTIGRLESIQRDFDPKFLDVFNRTGMAWAALQDKFGALPEEDKKELGRYTKFRQKSVANAALYVKYLSGVAVSEQEYQRIMTTLPNAGTKIFDGDSPTEFEAKMLETTKQSKQAMARAIYLNTIGFRGKPWEAGVALDDMEKIVDQRATEIEKELQGKVSPNRMDDAVRSQLKREFGI